MSPSLKKKPSLSLIVNAQVFTDGRMQNVQVLFDHEQILMVEENILERLAQIVKGQAEHVRIIDGEGLSLLPGLIDCHVHLREPGFEAKETIHAGSLAAAHGGFTTIFAMPNVKPCPSSVFAVEEYLKKIEQDAVIRVIPFGTITDDEQGKKPTDYQALKELGLNWFSDDGVGVADENVMRQAMENAARQNVLFSCHTEEMKWRRPGASVHEGAWAEKNGWIGIPSRCESDQLTRDLHLAKETGVCYHADHISAKESVEALAKAKAQGVDCSAEVTAHHLLLEDTDVRSPMWKMNPPLRTHEDRMALIEGLENGTLDFIASDHAPHTQEEKSQSMDKAPFGIVSLETSFPLLYTEFVAKSGRWSLADLIAWMAEKPAKRFGLKKSGKIQPGYRPDFFLADLNADEVIDPEKFLSKGKNTPFAGWHSVVKIKETWSMGESVYQDQERGLHGQR